MPSKRQDLLDRILTTETALLEYDSGTDDLRAWSWPIDKRGERVALYNFANHRMSHCFQNPYCICGDDTESAILVASTGPYRGFWTAACAQNSCGYFVSLDNLYVRDDISTKFYPRRGQNSAIPPPVVHILDTAPALPTTRSITKKAHDAPLPKFNPPPNATVSTTDLVNRLDSWFRPGLSAQQFKELFAQCECGMVTTRRMFNIHECIEREHVTGGVTGGETKADGMKTADVIDLTAEDGMEVVDLTGNEI